MSIDPNHQEAHNIGLRAVEIAQEFDHEMATLEHVLTALLEYPEVQKCLTSMSADIEAIGHAMEQFLTGGFISNNPHQAQPLKSTNFQHLFVRTIATSTFSSRKLVTALDLLMNLAQFPHEDNYAVTALMQAGITSLNLKKYIAHGNSTNTSVGNSSGQANTVNGSPQVGPDGSPVEPSPTNQAEAIAFIKKYATNLNELAVAGKIDPIIGRADELLQTQKVLARRRKNNVIYVGDPGVGKAQPLFSNILTPDGWIRMGDISMGDKVITPDGGTANVTGVFPQGVRSIWRMRFEDGRETHCDAQHLWKAYNKNWRRTGDKTGWKVVDTRELSANMARNKSQPFAVPLISSDQNEQNELDIELPLDPYVLGVLIGDGCLRGNNCNISSSDEELLIKIRNRLIKGYELAHQDRYDYRIRREIRTGSPSHYKVVMDEMNLDDTLSFKKFIPNIYFKASVKQRLELIQGLLDTDGTVDGVGGAISLCSTSITLATDFQRLIWSIGGIAKINQDTKKYTYKGEKKIGRPAYIISVRYRSPRDLFSLERKINKITKNYQYATSLKNKIESIEYVGDYEAQCIMIDHPDHLYITDDWIVTHNTSLAEGLAYNIVSGNVPTLLKNATVWSLDLGALVAGTRFRGDFEERMKNVLNALNFLSEPTPQTNPKSPPMPILFIDEIHMAMEAGSTNKGSLDVSNLLKPALAKGTLRCIGSTTLEEWRKHMEKDRALVRRFKKIQIDEPSAELTKAILRGLRTIYETYHEVTYTDAALDAAVDLTHRYVTTALLPDKAIDMIDQAGAAQRVAPENERLTIIDVKQIEDEVSKITKIPPQDMGNDESEKLINLESDLNSSVFGQPKAMRSLKNAVMIARAGLREINLPAGSYLFTGPTGCGKTETARQLAKTLGIPLIKFDMSEYMEKHAVSKLIGSPPGYVGFGDGGAGDGLLINAIDTNPSCVLLLDEIEKAHEDLFNILLQVMDDAKLTNSQGKTVSFKNVILIMTSNAGVGASDKNAIGFGRDADAGGIDQKAIKRLFKPEFRNRLDEIITFDPLRPEIMIKIVEKFLSNLNVLAGLRNVTVVTSDEAKQWLAVRGYDKVYGARPLARVIADNIKRPLSQEMLFGALTKGGTAYVNLLDDSIVITGEEKNSSHEIKTVETI